MGGRFQPGDWVVYRKQKHTSHPGPRAREVAPEPHGEFYTYQVEKFWVVAGHRDDRKLVLQTRRGKRHVVDADDHNLRPATLWERLFYRNRFPRLEGERRETSQL